MYSVPPGYPVPRSQWRERRDGCASCGKRFTFFTSKANCPCCGELFCSDCLQAEATLGEGREPSNVCLNCFSLIQDHRREAAKHVEHFSMGTPTSSRLSATPRTPGRDAASPAAPLAVPVETSSKNSSSLAQHAKALTAQAASLRAENELVLTKLANVETSLSEAQRTIAEKDKAQEHLQRVVRELQQRVEAHENDRAAPAGLAQSTPPPQGQQRLSRTSEPQTPLDVQAQRKAALYERQLKDQEVSHGEYVETTRQEVEQLRQRNAELERRSLHFEGELKEALEQVQALQDVNKVLEGELHNFTSIQPTSAQDVVDALRQQLSAVEEAKRDLEQQLASVATQEPEHDPCRSQGERTVADDVLRRGSLVTAGSTELCESTRWRQYSLVAPAVEKDVPVEMVELPQSATFLQWGGFDTMAANEDVPCVLAHVAREVADQWHLFEAPSPPALRERFIAMAALLSINYRSTNPYHNAIHAADVLQGTVSLITACDPLFSCMTSVEKKAVAFAAMAHDVRHPGRPAPFLKKCFDPIYLSFNGESVLEQLHTSTAFAFLSQEDTDFTADMTNEEALLFHDIVRRLILHTDMSKHDKSVAELGRRVWASPLDYTKLEDRLQVMSLLLHAADIGAQAKGVPIALKWLGVVEEMCQQGDDEVRRGFPVSAGCKRGGPVEPGQLFFLTRFVFPVFDLVEQLFPTVSQPVENLRRLFQHYQEATGGTDAFPSRITHRTAADKEMADLQARLDDASASLSDYKEKDATQKQYIQTLKEAADAADAARRMSQNQLHQLEAQLSASDARKSELEHEAASPADADNARSADDTRQLSEEQARMQAELANLQARRDSAEAEIESLQQKKEALSAATSKESTQADETVQQLQAELAQLREEADLWKQRAEAMKARTAEMTSALQDTVASLTADNERLQQEKAQLTTDAEAHQARLAALEADVATAREQLQSVTEDRDSVARTLSGNDEERQAELTQLREEADLWKQRAEAMKARAAEMTSALQDTVASLTADNERLQQEKAQLTTDAEAHQARLAALEADVATAREQLQSVTEDRDSVARTLSGNDEERQAELTQLRGEADLWKQRAEAMKARAAEQSNALTEAEQSIQQLHQQVEALESTQAQSADDVAAQTHLNQKLRSQISDLSEMIQEERQTFESMCAELVAKCESAEAAKETLSAELTILRTELSQAREALHSDELQRENSTQAAAAEMQRAISEAQAESGRLETLCESQRQRIADLEAQLVAKDDHQRTTLAQLKEKAAQLQSASHDLKQREEAAAREDSRLSALSTSLEEAQKKTAKDQQSVQEMTTRVKDASALLAKEKAALESAKAALEEQQRKAQAEAPSPQEVARIAQCDQREAAMTAAAKALVERERALHEKVEAFAEQVTQLEAREKRAAILSEQLAIIAEKMNHQQRRLRLREARLNGASTAGAGPRSHRSASMSTASPARPELDLTGAGGAESGFSSHLDSSAATCTLHAALRNLRDAIERGTHPMVPLVIDDE